LEDRDGKIFGIHKKGRTLDGSRVDAEVLPKKCWVSRVSD
jgi:hypothetical protein